MVEYKSDYPIIINSTSLLSNNFNNQYRYQFPQGTVKFKNSQVALGSVTMYYSWFNITAANNNNTYQFIWPTFAGSTTYTVTMPDGFYDAAGINSYLQQFCITNGLYLVNTTGQYVYYIEFLANATYYSIQLNTYPLPTSLPTGWTNPASMTFPATAKVPQLIVPSNNFSLVIGFLPATYPAVTQSTTYSVLSTFAPQITPIQGLILCCTLLNNKFSNPSTVLYSFGPEGATFGGTISSKPTEKSWVDISDGGYTSFDIQFLDQNFNNVTLADSNIIVQLYIR